MCSNCRELQRGRSRNFGVPIRYTAGRVVGIGFIRFYQLTFSSLVGSSCRHMPTCSEYGYEAVARHGLWSGGWLTLFRVVRCGPGGTWGPDPVPEILEQRFAWYAPWRLWTFSRKKLS